MTNKGVAIQYGDIAPEAKENFSPTSSETQFYTLEQLQKYNLDFPNYANPCELYQTVLDGTATAFPSDPEDANLGLWSEQITDNNGEFVQPIILTLTSEGQYSSQGLTLTFDTYNNIFATRVKIKWLRVSQDGEMVLSEKDFIPDSAFYFCQNKVENYNKVIITFYSLNMPQNRLKLRAIDYGYGTVFYGDELRNVKLIQAVDPISTQININTADFALNVKTNNMEYSFQAKQPLSVYFNGVLRATTFVKSEKRKSRTLYNIQSEDYIGLMDGVPFYGGMYNGKDAYDLLVEIFTAAKVPYTINPALKGVLLYGHIPFTTCRNALMQVAFAVQNVVDTSNSDVVNVYALDNNITQTIPLNRIRQGQNFSDEETVTGVEVAVHSYKAITETVDVYDATESGTGQNIFVKFSDPLHDLEIIGDGSFAVDENGNELKHTNYAVINANENCVLTGQKYEHTTQTRRKNNPVVLSSDIENVVAIEKATLVSKYNVDNVLEKCYNYLVRTNTVNLSIIEGKHVLYSGSAIYGTVKYGETKYGETGLHSVEYDKPVNVGEMIEAETEYLGNVSGRIIKQTFNLNGGIIVKEAVLR